MAQLVIYSFTKYKSRGLRVETLRRIALTRLGVTRAHELRYESGKPARTRLPSRRLCRALRVPSQAAPIGRRGTTLDGISSSFNQLCHRARATRRSSR